MSEDKILSEIRHVAETSIPKGAKVSLFGSRARGDARDDSDWDVLILLDKHHIQPEDHDLYAYPFWELGWQINAMIHPIIYSKDEWETNSSPILRDNVQREGLSLC